MQTPNPAGTWWPHDAILSLGALHPHQVGTCFQETPCSAGQLVFLSGSSPELAQHGFLNCHVKPAGRGSGL